MTPCARPSPSTRCWRWTASGVRSVSPRAWMAAVRSTSTQEPHMSGKPAARLSDPTSCPVPGHGTNPIAAGSPDVLFDSLPAARMGDASACGGAMAGAVIPTVLINGKPAAVVGSVGSHGNVVIGGSGTVIIGASGGGASFVSPAPVDIKGVFDEFFVLLDQDSGAPLSGVSY